MPSLRLRQFRAFIVEHVAGVEHAERMADLEQSRHVPVVAAEVALGDGLFHQRLLVGRAGVVGRSWPAPSRCPPTERAERGRHDVGRVAARLAARAAAEVGQHGVARGVDERLGPQVAEALDVVRDRRRGRCAGRRRRRPRRGA